ncbi:lysocardiolipin acyltransferase 1-like isoform X2 [Lycorma delicatula]|uniref:lysocardiolipin acyltransferase 1-like isoform X2 n=1 Tax=Lycorma delicatula TaxID=130591 RepID=UPI003F5187AB
MSFSRPYTSNKGGEMKRNWMKGILYCILWYTSIFSGFISLLCPLLPLLFIRPCLYRRLTELVFAMWEMYPVVLMEVLFGTKIIVSGDEILPGESSLLVMNHRTRLDWNFLWGAMFYASRRPSHRLKFVLKAPIRHTPGPGWVMQMAGFLYIHRNWNYDQALLGRLLDYLRDIQHAYQVLIFPEGTDLTECSIKKSNAFADSHKLEHYKRVLHPKTTGFTYLTTKMRENDQLDAIYDLSVGYPGALPQSELDVMKGIFPEEVHFFVKRYSTETIPRNESELKDWLNSIWKQKEQRLSEFYTHRTFTPDDEKPGNYKGHFCTTNALYLALIFWTSLVMITLYSLCMYTAVQVWTLFHCVVFITLSFTSEASLGHQQLLLVLFKPIVLTTTCF